MNNTISYYDNNADSFTQDTVNADLIPIYNRFLSYIPPDGKILDLGCGAGRDTKYFLQMGYKVDAADGSESLCRIASEYTGINVKHMLFSDLDANAVYDGIWACASVLHLPKDDLRDVFFKMIKATVKNGYIYTSFKYGDFEGCRNGRYYTDFTEKSFGEFIKDIKGIEIKETWTSADARPDRGDEKWINLIMKTSDPALR